ncbi:MAG: hypothetical protein II157_04415 [Bacteroidales bacterium]|nr:hypothetical protein [Bacteroidales bacterium]
MKLTRFLVGICCAAAVLTSCSKDENIKVEETSPVTITISTDDLATKTVIGRDDESGKYTHTWKDGDALSCIIAHSSTEYYMDKFVLVSGAGTKTGTFSCSNSHVKAEGYTYPTIIYPYSDEEDGGWYNWSWENQEGGSLENLSKYIVLYARATFQDKVFKGWFGMDSTPRFLADSYFLKFPQGLQIVGNAPGNHTVDLTFSASGSSTVKNRQQYAKNYYSGTSVDGSIKLTGVALTDGKLAKDTYMYVRASREPGSTFTLEVKEGTNSVSYTLTSGSSYKSTGGVYKLNQSNFTPILDF